ncbi:lysocardiolipin and lysophospholipid acyltransferase [Fistulifera solaris]|uniref:Lysocardiolipin and lysophospholipid acyltransferase n=1 Tax=Fistulifera solaris TaxID=1519565 RepID=A0A1Z5JNC2_FISSO|nr:lysocardiolipin and lysophospholipid acyltransferase [Fistulifera solaris]|eukprot:GAX15515.1 lysocardiolipin and lysophospholipid acyltransferase [Fistulifera solaris]
MFAVMDGSSFNASSNTLFHRNGTSGERHAPPRVRFPDETPPQSSGVVAFVTNLITSFVALLCIFGLMTILVVLFVTVRPFSQNVYRRLAAQLGAASFLDAIALLLPNTKIYLTGDSDIPSPVGTSVMISNHVYESDWWWMLMLGRCVGLRGSLKVFLRNEYLNLSMNSGEPPSTAVRPAGALAASNSSSRIVTFSRIETNGETGSPGSSASGASSPTDGRNFASCDISIAAKLLHLFLEMPLVNEEDYVSDREQLFQLLRSFAAGAGASSPVHLLLFPEGWSLHHGADRLSVHAKSNEFAKRERRPQLKHLLLPRNRGFKATLECLRESSPVVYDVTIAYPGYDGSLPPSPTFSLFSLWEGLLCKLPREVHIRIKRYSLEEVLQDSSWMDKKWAEKDRLLSYFSRHQSFPMDARGYRRPRIFDTRHHSIESSLVSLGRLLLLPCTVPILLLLSIPLFWTLLTIWLIHKGVLWMFGDETVGRGDSRPDGASEAAQTPGSVSAAGTPYCPTTPFASPSVATWRDMLSGRG